MPVNEMTVGNLTRKMRSIEKQNFMAFAGQEHRGGRAGAPRSDDNNVVHAFLTKMKSSGFIVRKLPCCQVYLARFTDRAPF